MAGKLKGEGELPLQKTVSDVDDDKEGHYEDVGEVLVMHCWYKFDSRS